MKRSFAALLSPLVFFCLALAQAPAGKPASSEHPKVRQYFMALLHKGPNWVDIAKTPEDSPARKVAAAHLKGLAQLLDAGKATALGPCSDSGDIAGIIIYQVATEDEAKQLVSEDPFVKSGFMTANVYSWWTTPEAFAKAPFSMNLGQHYFVLLLKGDQSQKLSKEEGDQLQESHMANIRKLASEGKLSVAGPFDGDPTLRGIFVIEAASEAEARSYVETDPMIKRGRLVYEIHTWMVPRGLLATAKK